MKQQINNFQKTLAKLFKSKQQNKLALKNTYDLHLGVSLMVSTVVWILIPVQNAGWVSVSADALISYHITYFLKTDPADSQQSPVF